MLAQLSISCVNSFSDWKQLHYQHIRGAPESCLAFSLGSKSQNLWELVLENFSVQMFQDKMFLKDQLRWIHLWFISLAANPKPHREKKPSQFNRTTKCLLDPRRSRKHQAYTSCVTTLWVWFYFRMMKLVLEINFLRPHTAFSAGAMMWTKWAWFLSRLRAERSHTASLQAMRHDMALLVPVR